MALAGSSSQLRLTQSASVCAISSRPSVCVVSLQNEKSRVGHCVRCHALLPALISGAVVTGLAATMLTRVASNAVPRKCTTCFGAGFYPCDGCKGRGKVGGCLPDAPPLTSCDACEARGRVRCVSCKGQGLSNAWLFRPAKDPGWGPRGQ